VTCIVTSAARCRQPRSSLWCSPWCYPGWTTETPYWLAFRPLPSTSSTVGTECGSTADLPHEIRGPHHRRSCLPSLAVRLRADRIQGRCTDVQSSTRKCAALLGTTRSCCRSARPTDIMLWWHQSSAGAGDRAFTVAGPRVWNTLPEEITTSQSLNYDLLSTFQNLALQEIILGPDIII